MSFRHLSIFPKAIPVPISGLVVTFVASHTTPETLIQALEKIPEIEVGEFDEHRIAMVVDSETRQRDQEIWDAVQQLPGVSDINVAFVGFDDAEREPD